MAPPVMNQSWYVLKALLYYFFVRIVQEGTSPRVVYYSRTFRLITLVFGIPLWY